MKKKNSLLFILAMIIPLSCNSQDIKRIDILFVDSEIETPFRISCDKFKIFFRDDIDSISIQDPELIEKFSNELNNLIIADKAKYSLSDTRTKLKLIYNHNLLEICIDSFVVSKDGELFLLSDTLKRLIGNEITKVGK
jgi:hypothetical protein